MNGTRELALQLLLWLCCTQLLDHHVQEDQRWSPHGPCPPDCIVDLTSDRIIDFKASTHAQCGQFTAGDVVIN